MGGRYVIRPTGDHHRHARLRRASILAIAVAVGAAALLTGCAAGDQTAESGTAPDSTPADARPAPGPPGATRTPSTPRRGDRPSPVVLSGAVTDVVDGDTIKVESRGFETTVRLVGIDTPETRRPGGFVQCFGPAASTRAKSLLPIGRRVRLVTDPTQDQRDRYGRLLAYVYTPGASGATGSINYALVATGYAKTYVYRGTPFQHVQPFRVAEARAKRLALGLWGPPCDGDTTKRDRDSHARP